MLRSKIKNGISYSQGPAVVLIHRTVLTLLLADQEKDGVPLLSELSLAASTKVHRQHLSSALPYLKWNIEVNVPGKQIRKI